MKKKLSILLIAVMTLITLIPFGSVFASYGENGLVSQGNISANMQNVVDGDLNTSNAKYGNGELGRITFDNPIPFVGTMFLRANEDPVNEIRIYNSAGTVIYASNGWNLKTGMGKYITVNLSDVKTVVFYNTYQSNTTVYVYEFDLYEGGIPNIDLSGGLLDSKNLILSPDVITTTSTTLNATDNNINTSVLLGANDTATDNIYYVFDKENTISSIKTIVGSSGALLRLYDSNNTVLHEANVLSGSQTIPIPDINAKKISIKNTTTSNIVITEINAFGKVVTDTEPPEEITDLSATTTTTGATFNWSNPADSDFSKVNIYQNGTLKGSSTNGTYTVSGLTQGTEYNYTFKTVDSTGNESEGTIKTINTKPDSDGDGITDSEDYYPEDSTNTPAPAGEVAELVITPEYNKVKLSWKLPGTANFKNVTIYREAINQETGFLNGLFGSTVYAAALFETNGTTFTDLTVEPETDYEYTVKTNSIDGMESAGVTGTTTTPKKPLLTDLSLPFSVNELVKAGNELLWFIGPILLLALSFLLFPKLRKLIVNSFRNNRKGKEGSEKDQALRRFRTDEKEQKEKHDGKEHIEKTDKLQKERQEREKREREARAAEPKIKETRAPKESNRERRRAEKQMRIAREPRAPRAPRERTRAAREPGGKRRSS